MKRVSRGFGSSVCSRARTQCHTLERGAGGIRQSKSPAPFTLYRSPFTLLQFTVHTRAARRGGGERSPLALEGVPAMAPSVADAVCAAVFSQLGGPRTACPGLSPACPGELQRAQRAGTAAPTARVRSRGAHAAPAGPREFRPSSWATRLSLATQRREPAFSFGRLERSASPDVRRAPARGGGAPRVRAYVFWPRAAAGHVGLDACRGGPWGVRRRAGDARVAVGGAAGSDGRAAQVRRGAVPRAGRAADARAVR